MAEEPEETDTTQQNTGKETSEKQTPTPQPPHGDEKEPVDWKAESRKWEARSKANAQAAAELEGLKQEKEAADHKAADLQTKLDKLTHDVQIRQWRGQVSEEKHVPLDLLQGATLKEMRESADRLIAWAKPARNTPVSLGQEPKAANTSADAEFVRQIFHHQS